VVPGVSDQNQEWIFILKFSFLLIIIIDCAPLITDFCNIVYVILSHMYLEIVGKPFSEGPNRSDSRSDRLQIDSRRGVFPIHSVFARFTENRVTFVFCYGVQINVVHLPSWPVQRFRLDDIQFSRSRTNTRVHFQIEFSRYLRARFRTKTTSLKLRAEKRKNACYFNRYVRGCRILYNSWWNAPLRRQKKKIKKYLTIQPTEFAFKTRNSTKYLKNMQVTLAHFES